MYIVKFYIISVPKYYLMGNGWKWVEMGKFFPKSTDMDGFGFEKMGRNGLGPKILPHEGLYWPPHFFSRSYTPMRNITN